MEQFDFNPDSNKPQYIAVHIPQGAQTNVTQIRWWQPSKDGKYLEDWAVDQVGMEFSLEILPPPPVTVCGQPLHCAPAFVLCTSCAAC